MKINNTARADTVHAIAADRALGPSLFEAQHVR